MVDTHAVSMSAGRINFVQGYVPRIHNENMISSVQKEEIFFLQIPFGVVNEIIVRFYRPFIQLTQHTTGTGNHFASRVGDGRLGDYNE